MAPAASMGERTDPAVGLGGLELNSPREPNGLSAPMEEEGGTAEERRRERAAQMDRASALIGQRMLQGWAMLDLSCPQCYSPIMRDRQRQLWCVACDMRVVDESQQANGGVEATGQAAPPKRKTSPEVAEEAAMEHRGSSGEEGGRGPKRQATDAALSGQTEPASLDLQHTARELLASLVDKLKMLHKAVQLCQGREELSQLFDLIHKTASTIKAVKELEQLDV